MKALNLKSYKLIELLTVITTLLILVNILHLKAIDFGWQFEDPFHILMAVKYSPFQYFTQPEIMLESTYAHITPWNVFFYEIGIYFFGLEAKWSYIHIQIIILLIAVLTYYILINFTSKIYAVIGACIYLTLPTVALATQVLMIAHYSYGLLFSLITVIFFQKSLEKNSFNLSIVAAFFYGLACLCKELYVPLPLILICIPYKTISFRLKYFLPIAFIALIYSLFRLWLLGGIGGYGKGHYFSINNYFTILVEIKTALFGGDNIIFYIYSSIIVLGLLLKFRSKLLLVFAVIVALILPLIPVLNEGFEGVNIRFLIPLSWVVSFGFIYFLQTIDKIFKLKISLLIIPILCVGLYINVNNKIYRTESYSIVNNWILAEPIDSDKVLFLDNDLTIGVGQRLASALKIIKSKSVMVLSRRDDIYKISDNANIYIYSINCNCISKVEGGKATLIKQWEKELDGGKILPLKIFLEAVKINSRGLYTIKWNFGPNQEGKYLMLYKDLAIPLPINGANTVFLPEALVNIKIRYISPKGLVVESPEFDWDLKNEVQLKWEKCLNNL